MCKIRKFKFLFAYLTAYINCTSCGPDQLAKEGQDVGNKVIDFRNQVATKLTSPKDEEQQLIDQTVLNISFKVDLNKGGDLCMAVFNDKSEYNKDQNTDDSIEYEALSCFNISVGKIKLAVAKGRDYAVSVFHDQNQNQILDTVGPLKIPKEGFGFSNNPHIIAGKPSWEKVKITAHSDQMDLNIELNYLLN